MKPTKSSMLKKTVFTTVSAMVLSGPALAAFPETRFLVTNMPHAYEFGSENPYGLPSKSYYWCGHTALKIAAMYKTGTNKTLSQINETFKNNSPGGFKLDTNCASVGVPGKHWCAKLQDLVWATQLSQNGGYGRSQSELTTTATTGTAAKFYNTVRANIVVNNPIIAPTRTLIHGVGHFWVIVGYTDKATPETSVLYLRDVAIPSPIAGNADRAVFAQDFWNDMETKGQSLIVR